MKHLSQMANKVFSNKAAFPKSQDQKTLERQRGELDSFMLSFSSHEQIVESIHKTLFEIFKARNLSGMPIRDLRVDDFAGLKDGWKGTFGDRTTLLEGEIGLVIDGSDRDRVCGRVVELLSVALIAVGYGGNFDNEIYEGYKNGNLSVGGTAGTRRGSAISTLTTPSKIFADVDVDDLDDDTSTTA